MSRASAVLLALAFGRPVYAGAGGPAPAAAATSATSTPANPARAEELRREIARLRGLGARYANAERSLLGEIDALARESLLAERELDLARVREREGEQQLRRLELEEKDLRARLDRSRVGLRRVLLAAYERRQPPELWALVAGSEPLDVPRNLRRIAAVGESQKAALREF